MRILFISQIAEAELRLERGIPRDAETMPSIFAELGVDLTVVDATDEPLPDPSGFHGVVVSGSLGSANDQEPWRLVLLDWLRHINGAPLFGICGGHQLYALARGGVVGPCAEPQGGMYPIDLPGVPGFGGVVVQAHGEAVLEVPAGAEVWARDEVCVQALRYSPTVWTTQFHPELDVSLVGLVLSLWEAPRAPEQADVAVRDGKLLLRAWLDAVRAQRER